MKPFSLISFLLNYIIFGSFEIIYKLFARCYDSACVETFMKNKFSEYEFKTRTLIVYLDVCECLSNERYFYLEWSRGRLMFET